MNSKIFYNKSSNKTLYSKKIYLLVQIVFLSGIKIEKNIIIGAGSVVLNNLVEPGLYYSKKLTKNEKTKNQNSTDIWNKYYEDFEKGDWLGNQYPNEFLIRFVSNMRKKNTKKGYFKDAGKEIKLKKISKVMRWKLVLEVWLTY